MQDKEESFSTISSLLARADETYASIPPKVKIQIEEVAKSIPEVGPRRLLRTGAGSDMYDARGFRQGIDDPRSINARLSARHGFDIITERQAENRQPVFFWRKGFGSTTVKYEPNNPDRLTKKEYLDVVMLASAMAIAATEDKVGILDHGALYSGSGAAASVANRFFDVNIITGPSPVVGRRLPVGSTVILGSDFYAGDEDREQLARDIEMLKTMGVNGQVLMVIDPEELEFPFEGHVRFEGTESELPYTTGKSEALRDIYRAEINKHIQWVSDMAHANGYKFVLQRTDTEPLDLALKIFGMDNGGQSFDRSLKLG